MADEVRRERAEREAAEAMLLSLVENAIAYLSED